MVATLILAIGLFATIGVIDAANRTTGVTRSREAAVNLARSIVEGARAVPYAQLDQSGGLALLQAQPGLADASGAAGWQLVRRGVTYTATFSTCSVDDPTDGIGADDATFCRVNTPTNPPDPAPADYKRVSVNLNWTDSGGAHVLNQSGLVTASYHGPSVLSLSGPTDVYISQANPGFIDFSATTSTGASNVHWYVDGNDQGLATGGGTSWVFSWNLGAPTGGAPCTPPDPNNPTNDVQDGTYIVKASAFDGLGLSADSRAVTVQINRCPPAAPTNFEGGESRVWPGVELQWDDSPEEDVVGYYLYKSTSPTGPWTTPIQPYLSPDPTQPVCSGLVTTSNCVDSDTSVKLYYRVQAVDRDPSGNLRTGDMSPVLLVDPANGAPRAPKNVDPDSSGTPFSIQFQSANPPGSPPPSDYTDFYWIYRDGFNGRIDRYDSVSVQGGTIVWTDPDPAGVAHTYWVTAVDNHLAEATATNKQKVVCTAAGVCT